MWATERHRALSRPSSSAPEECRREGDTSEEEKGGAQRCHVLATRDASSTAGVSLSCSLSLSLLAPRAVEMMHRADVACHGSAYVSVGTHMSVIFII